MGETLTFHIVKEPYGWAVRLPREGMMPFRSRRRAFETAARLASDCRWAGARAEVAVDESWPTASPAWRRARRRPALAWLTRCPAAVRRAASNLGRGGRERRVGRGG